MSVGTFLEIGDREYRVAGPASNVAIRADSNLQPSLDVHIGKTAITDRLDLAYLSPQVCLA